MHVRPLIGIPLCLDDRGRWRAGRDYVYADRSYAAALSAAGATPVHLPTPTAADSSETGAIVDRLDGVLIPGGDDFPAPDPAAYPPGVFDLAPSSQVDFDRALVQATREAGKPLLGVCYGMQLLALDAGGSIYPHLPTDLVERDVAIDHGGGKTTTHHEVTVTEGSQLAAIVASSTLSVNSRHHQGIREAGALSVCAQAADGLIEAIEARSGSFAIGVQWHPESLAGQAGAGLIRAFVEEAERSARSSRSP